MRKFKDGPAFLEALMAVSGVEEGDVKPGSAMAEGRMVVLLDILMGMDGFGVLERIESLPSSALAGMTVFMLSATLDRTDLSVQRAIRWWRPCFPVRLDVHQLRGWVDQILG